MSTNWIATVITKARESRALVTDAASARIQELMNGQLGEGQLSAGELRKIAKELIEKMATSTPNEERPE